ncbi:TPA: hypothetical protein ACX6QU_001340 [Photobacterium damselae]
MMKMKKTIYFVILFFYSISSKSEINPIFIHGKNFDEKGVNEFINGKLLPPGDYILPFYVNGEYSGDSKVEIKENNVICKDLTGLKFFYNNKVVHGLDCGEFDNKTKSKFIIDKEKNIVTYKVNEKFLYERFDANYLKKELKNNIINSLYANYNLQFSNNKYSDHGTTSGSFSINGNLNDYRLVSNYNIISDKINKTDFYIAKPLYDMKGEVKFGEFNNITDPLTSEGTYIRGVEFKTDRDLYLQEKRHYPYIGYVSEPSDIYLYQNGRLIKQFFVNSGEYTLDNVLASSPIYGDVEIIEKGISGNEKKQRIYLPSLQNLLLSGEHYVSMAIGSVVDIDDDNKYIANFIYKYGFKSITPYLTALTMSNYRHISIGTSIYTGGDSELGLFFSRSHTKNKQGNSFGVSYRAFIPSINLDLDVSSFRYFDSDYLSINNYINSLSGNVLSVKSKTNIGLTYNTGVDIINSIYFRYDNSQYWNKNQIENDLDLLTVGVQGVVENSFFESSLWTLSSSFSMNDHDNSIMASISIPFNNRNHDSFDVDSVMFVTEKDIGLSNYNTSAMLRGGDYDLNYYAKLSSNAQNNQLGLGANIFDMTYVNANLSSNYQSVQTTGSIALTQDTGIKFQPRQLTNPILVKADGFEGTKQLGAMIDSNGYAITDSTGIPYDKQTWRLDAAQAKSNTIVLSDKVSFHLPKGTMTKVKFNTLNRQYYYMTLRLNGEPVPLGTHIKYGKVDYFTQLNGALVISAKQDIIKIKLKLVDSNKYCSVNLDKLKFDSNSKTIPNIGDINCE